MSMAALAGPIERAFRPQKLAAVALAINSPGGSPVQSSLIAKRIRALATEKSVPVVAFVEDAAASGGYWLACAADEIFADPSSIVGSIGVVSGGFGFPDMIKRLGIERRLHTSGDNKAMLDPFSPEKPDDVERLKAIQADIHEAFKQHVRERRGGRLKASDETLFNGEFWTGGRALDLGLIDGLSDLRTTMRQRFGDKVRLRPVTAGRSWPRWMGGGGEGSSAPGAERWMAAGIAAVEERLWWGRLGL
jgi:signal peptide peptidase SppA